MTHRLCRLIFCASTALILFSQISCQNSNDLDVDDIKKQLNGNIPELGNINSSNLPSEEDIERMIKEKCEKNGGGEEAFEALKNQQKELQTCLESQLNMTQIQQEVDKAKETGSMDEVFGKYCNKYPEIHKCIENVTEKVRPCLDVNEQETLNKTLMIVLELKEFVCFKDGDRIAMFIAEGGVQCLESKKEELQVCVNKTLGSRMPTDMSVNSLPSFLFTERDCNDFDTVRKCVNVELEKCKDSTPANIVDAFFKFLKKHMPCQAALKQEGGGSSSSFVESASFVMLTTSVLIVQLLQFF